jgi:hypothetical protein
MMYCPEGVYKRDAPGRAAGKPAGGIYKISRERVNMAGEYASEPSPAGGSGLMAALKRFYFSLGEIVEIPEPVAPADAKDRKGYPMFEALDGFEGFEEDTAGDLRDK